MWLSSAKGSSWRELEAKVVGQHPRGKILSVPKGDLTGQQHGIRPRLCPRLSWCFLIWQSHPVTSNIIHIPITPKCLSKAEISSGLQTHIYNSFPWHFPFSGSQVPESQHVQNWAPDLSPQTCSSWVASWWIAPSFIHYPTRKLRGILDTLFLTPTSNHRVLIILPPKPLTSVHLSLSMTPESILASHLTSLLATVFSSPPIILYTVVQAITVKWKASDLFPCLELFRGFSSSSSPPFLPPPPP